MWNDLQTRIIYVFFVVLISAIALSNGAMAESANTGAVFGRVLDYRDGSGIDWANVELLDTHQGASTHSNGEFHIFMVPAGTHQVKASYLGFRDEISEVFVTPGDTVTLDIYLKRSSLQLKEARVFGHHSHEHSSIDENPALRVSGGELQRELGLTIAETIDEEPGIAQRSMGPAPARPVLRGLSGDRLMILEDGHHTGDLSATSSDHAVAIEPITASDVEVIRGAETLLYGSGVIGGVVNINRGMIPTSTLHRVIGDITLQGESVNLGGGLALDIEAPVRWFTIKMDGSLRGADDIETPSGTLQNTGIDTRNAGLGISLPKPWGVVGIAGTYYDSNYGVPGGFVGAHPNGVSIELNRRNLEIMGRYYPEIQQIRQIEMTYSFARYYHAEWESSGILGMEFGVLTDNIDAKVHLDSHLWFDKGAIGVRGGLRNYASGGLSFTPPTREGKIGVYIYEQKKFGSIDTKGAVRYDLREIKPDREYHSVVAGDIKKRTFSGVSSAISVELPLYGAIRTGTSLMYSWRAPTVEELFSEGPHLAVYSFEIGNPDLEAERGLGTEVYVAGRISNLRGRIAVFQNRITDYIYPSYSGKLSARRNDLYEYRYKGRDVLMTGIETNWDWDFSSIWNFHGALSYTHGKLTDRDVPMPLIPPLGGRLGFMHRVDCCTFNFDAVGSAAQDRLYVAEDPDAQPEDPTSAWVRYDFSVQLQRSYFGLLHTAVFAIDNVTDTEYRNHLSRVKIVMPEPGRNFKLTYKVYL